MKNLGFGEEGEEDMCVELEIEEMENWDLCVRGGHVGRDGPSHPQISVLFTLILHSQITPPGSIHIANSYFFSLCQLLLLQQLCLCLFLLYFYVSCYYFIYIKVNDFHLN